MLVAWMPYSQRTATLAGRLGYEVHLFGRRGFRRPWTAALAYPWLAVRTAALLLRRRPKALIVVAPPFVAAVVTLPVARLIGARMAVDIHTGALLDRRWRWSVPILAFVTARSLTGIVTLPSLRDLLAARGAKALVIPDPLPRPGAEPRPPGDEVVLVCGWGDDEPIRAAMDAARGEPWRLAVTGRPRAGRSADAPPNVRLTGFLSDPEYAQLLAGAAAVVVLTTREDTLLSGAWEALSYRRPLVTSDTAALRTTFGPSVTYVTPDAGSIREGIRSVLASPAAPQEAERLAAHFQEANDAALVELRGLLESAPAPPPAS
jgi:hypothetical protein